MAETSAPTRGEIITDVGPPPESRVTESVAGSGPSPQVGRAVPAQWEPVVRPAPAADAPSEQLARLEDKTARIEEKLARSEAATQRVVDRFETASSRMGEVALQSDLATVRGEVAAILRRVRGLPGFSALIATSLITAILTSVIFIAILRYMPALIAR